VTSPSLFAEDRIVIVSGVERATDELLTDGLAYVAAPQDDVVLVLRHAGGQRGKKLLDAVRSLEDAVVSCEPLKKDSEKSAFVTAELRRAGRRADAAAVRGLIDAVGSDLRELAAACAQLAADTTGAIGADVVERYYGGRIEATGFRVADAAVEGDAGRAVALLRHALATGVDPVPIVAALAAKLRVLAKVAATRGRGSAALRDLSLAPWQVDRALKELARWTPESLAAAITAVAQADAEVKGASRDPRFAIERAVLRVASTRGR
jgi:DNA polymerase-3 subunit delta